MDGIVVLWKAKKDFNVLTILSSFESFRLIFTPACSTFRTWRAADLTPVFYSCPITWSFRWPPLVGVFRYGLEFFIHKQPGNLVSSATLDPYPMIYDLPPLHTRRRDLIGTV